uniref:Heterogeneous nuclear ribonucleoproteins A2/B1-like n=1 Tax=Phallusia mammillata TaxID=59560 RepID=A0A6F9DF96_9ASCI|nr:heterogeneous nuclear ribonucleoproteins A2/B1-like [Phallusia mammillata]
MSDDAGKLFVGGLSWATTDDKMRDYFSQYGMVIECKVMKDKVTDNPRGFGFVKFENPDSVAAVMKARPHVLDEKQVDAKPCTPKDVQQKKKEADRLHVTTHKIFVGGLPRDISEEEVKSYFNSFGTVLEVNFAISKLDNKNKGFGFVTFSDADGAQKAISKHYHEVGGKRVEAKKAEPRDSSNRSNYNSQENNQWGNSNNYGGGQGNMGQGYNNQMQGNWNGAGGYGYGMQQPMMGPSGGYMPPNQGYGYGGYGGPGAQQAGGNMYSGYGGYGGYTQQQMPNQTGAATNQNQGQGQGNGYQQMGQYNQYGSSYGPTYGNNKSGGQGDNSNAQAPATDGGRKDNVGANKTGYHPYKR